VQAGEVRRAWGPCVPACLRTHAQAVPAAGWRCNPLSFASLEGTVALRARSSAADVPEERHRYASRSKLDADHRAAGAHGALFRRVRRRLSAEPRERDTRNDSHVFVGLLS
jgi:hypothetical protein